MQKDKFDRQVTLLRKYYSGTLEKREKQEFREMLNDRNLENVFRQLSQGDILAEKLEEYKQYDARKLSANSAGNKNRFVIKRGLSGFLLQQQWWFYF